MATRTVYARLSPSNGRYAVSRASDVTPLKRMVIELPIAIAIRSGGIDYSSLLDFVASRDGDEDYDALINLDRGFEARGGKGKNLFKEEGIVGLKSLISPINDSVRMRIHDNPYGDIIAVKYRNEKDEKKLVGLRLFNSHSLRDI